MSLFRKLLILKNDLGLVIIGLLFAVIGGLITIKGSEEGILFPLCFMIIGIVVVIYGIIKIVKEIKTPAEEYTQYDRVDLQSAPVDEERTAYNEDDAEDFVFHYTGKLNQSYVMEDKNGSVVYEAITDKLLMIGGRKFTFRNTLTGAVSEKNVGACVTRSVGSSEAFGSVTISSTFKIDNVDVWDMIASKGYGFKFSMNGIACHYDVKHWGEYVGFAELGGTGLINPKYANNPLGKVPTNGILKVHCTRADIEGFFLICFAVSLTEFMLDK